MTMKNDAKIQQELTCRFKIDMWNFLIFDPTTQKSKKCVFQLTPCDKSIYCLNYKSTQELSFMTLKSFAKFEKKPDLLFEKRLEKFGRFSPEHLKVSKLGL